MSQYTWVKFDFIAVLADGLLARCPMDTQGFFWRVYAQMGASPVQGKLLTLAGQKMTANDLAFESRLTVRQVEGHLSTLISIGIFTQDSDGILTCPRLVQMIGVSRAASEKGQKSWEKRASQALQPPFRSNSGSNHSSNSGSNHGSSTGPDYSKSKSKIESKSKSERENTLPPSLDSSNPPSQPSDPPADPPPVAFVGSAPPPREVWLAAAQKAGLPEGEALEHWLFQAARPEHEQWKHVATAPHQLELHAAKLAQQRRNRLVEQARYSADVRAPGPTPAPGIWHHRQRLAVLDETLRDHIANPSAPDYRADRVTPDQAADYTRIRGEADDLRRKIQEAR